MRIGKDSNTNVSEQSSISKIPILQVSENPQTFPLKGSLAYDIITDTVSYGNGTNWFPVTKLPILQNPPASPMQGSLAYDTITDTVSYGNGANWIPISKLPTVQVSQNPQALPVQGSLVYDTITNSIWYGNGTSWAPIMTGGRGVIPGLMPVVESPLNTPGIVTGDRAAPEDAPPQPDTSPFSVKEPVYLAPAPPNATIPFTVITTGNVGIPTGYTDPVVGSVADLIQDPWVPFVLEKPKPGRDEGIYWVLGNASENPVAVLITQVVGGAIGSIIGGTVNTVISAVIDPPEIDLSWLISGGQPVTESVRARFGLAFSEQTGLAVSGFPGIELLNITARVTYSRIPITSTLVDNTITIHGVTMSFLTVAPGNTAQIDIFIPKLFGNLLFYAPNLDDPLMEQIFLYQLSGKDASGISYNTLALVVPVAKQIPGATGYKDTIRIIIPDFPSTNFPGGDLYLPTMIFRYISRLNKEYSRDYLRARNTA